MTDNVNHPAHYGGADDPYEVIKVAEAWGFDKDAYLFQVLKYIRRDKTDQLEDLKKALFFLNRKIALMEGTSFTPTSDQVETTQVGNVTVTTYGQPKGMMRWRQRFADAPACYISVYTDIANDQFSAYAINAYKDWTIGTLADLVAAGAKRPCGSYTISVSKEPEIRGLKADASVAWMLTMWPPENYHYYLKKILP